jgi:hypothetical protein
VGDDEGEGGGEDGAGDEGEGDGEGDDGDGDEGGVEGDGEPGESVGVADVEGFGFDVELNASVPGAGCAGEPVEL